MSVTLKVIRIVRKLRTAMLPVLFLAVAASGCSRGNARPEHPPQSAEQNLHFVGLAYHQAFAKNGHAPTGAEELLPALKKLGYTESVLASPNDGKPFTLCWGIETLKPGGSDRVIAYETIGAGGKKYVLNNMLAVKQMADSELQEALKVPN